MAYTCPICLKEFSSKVALRNHTGTSVAACRRPHTCPKCAHKFCSQKAMENHRDAPSHTTMFSCTVCQKPSGSRQAKEQHDKKSSLHARMLARVKPAGGLVVGASSQPKNVPSSPTQPRTRAAPSTSINQGAPGNSDSQDEYADDDDYGAWTKGHSHKDWDEDRNWALCDSDCGWCGHCADGVDF